MTALTGCTHLGRESKGTSEKSWVQARKGRGTSATQTFWHSGKDSLHILRNIKAVGFAYSAEQTALRYGSDVEPCVFSKGGPSALSRLFIISFIIRYRFSTVILFIRDADG